MRSSACWLLLMVFVGMASAAQSAPYARRDGRVEARADLAAGRPLKLYVHEHNGRAPGFRTPGLTSCSPHFNSGRAEARGLFVLIPEANWSEGERYTAAQLGLAADAERFAHAYNQTGFAARKRQIARACPKVRLEQ
jgi:hypothetical protein